MPYENLTIERDKHVATITLNRPDRLNALNLDLMEEIETVADELRQDTQTRAVVFTGSGKYFTAGADLNDPRRAALGEDTLLARQRATHIGQRMTAKLQAIPQITIAAINGGALGGGAVIVSALDFRIAAEGSFVSYPEINLGMNLSWFGLPLCVRLIGPARAKRMVILGRKEPAAVLLDWGFIDEIVPPDSLLNRAKELAEEYAKQPPMAAQMIKRSANVIANALDQAIMHMDTDQFVLTSMSDESKEGLAAFREKREAKF